MATLTHDTIRQALFALGDELKASVELLIVGGGAGVLTGELPPAWTTSDVDAMEFRPPGEVEEVLRAAAEVGKRQLLPANWLNIDSGLYRHDLPSAWESRAVDVGSFGRLRVRALSRRDLIATKFYAHRTIDREHLTLMKVKKRELQFVREYLSERAGDDPGKAAKALAYVEAWEAV